MRKPLSVLLLCAAAATSALTGTTTRPASSLPASADTKVTVAALSSTPQADPGRSFKRFAFLFPEDPATSRWNPCTPVLWKMNSVGYNKKRFGQALKAVRQLRRATGLTIRYAGLTTPEEIESGELGVITVSFVSPKEMTGDAIGTAGVALHSSSVGGGIARADIRIALHTGFNRQHGYLPVLLHEFGHAVGLDHSDDELSAMYAFENGVAQFNKSDIIGLRAVGARNGCIVTPTIGAPPAPPAEPVAEPITDPLPNPSLP